MNIYGSRHEEDTRRTDGKNFSHDGGRLCTNWTRLVDDILVVDTQ